MKPRNGRTYSLSGSRVMKFFIHASRGHEVILALALVLILGRYTHSLQAPILSSCNVQPAFIALLYRFRHPSLCRAPRNHTHLSYNFTLTAVNTTLKNANRTGSPLVFGQNGATSGEEFEVTSVCLLIFPLKIRFE